MVGTLGLDDDTVEGIDRLCPDVVLLDADGHAGDRLALASAIHATPAGPSVVLYVADSGPPALREARRAGIHRIALKRSSVGDLLDQLEAAVALRPLADAVLAAELIGPVLTAPAPTLLSRREGEILELLSRGLTREGIAQVLVLSSETVKTHISNAMVKLEASTRVQAIAIAIRRGHISREDSSPACEDARSTALDRHARSPLAA